MADVATGQQLSTELVERARGLVDFLAEKAPETEALRQVSPDVIEALDRADLFAVGAPATFGGPDIDLDTMFEMGYELGRGCTSAAWCWGLWAAHSWYMGYATQEAQEELYADGPDLRLSSGVKSEGAVVELVDGGCLLSGKWGLSSGIDHAQWVMVGAQLPNAGASADQLAALMLVPRSQVTIEDDWYVMGLKGTGSKTVVIEEPVFVPEHRFLLLDGAENGPAKATHGRASYGLPPQMPIVYITASPLIGAARAAVDTLSEQMKSRRHSFTGARRLESVGLQMRIAEAAAEVECRRRPCADRPPRSPANGCTRGDDVDGATGNDATPPLLHRQARASSGRAPLRGERHSRHVLARTDATTLLRRVHGIEEHRLSVGRDGRVLRPGSARA